MRWASIRKMDISNGLGVGVSLFVQGCPIHCEGCFQPETWDFYGGKEFTSDQIDQIAELVSAPYIERFSLLGGEPLFQGNWGDIQYLFTRIKEVRPDIKIWIYSGYEIKELVDAALYNAKLMYILDNTDVLVCGPFIQKQKDITLKFKGSFNQRVLNMRESDWRHSRFVELEL